MLLIDKRLFYYTSKILNGNKINVRVGEYFFAAGYKPRDVVQKLTAGEVFYRKITIAEGLSNDTIFKIIDSTPGLIGNLPYPYEVQEGTLLPETYLYTAGETKKNLILRMQQAMKEFFDREWNNRDPNLPFKTKHEALSLASIVEKETGIPDERALIASVFINRIKIDMPLQSDPTVVYAFTMGNKDLERPIKKSDLQRPSKYNTYRTKGIPDPISNPGKDAIKAVLHPAHSNYLFFVATGNGGHNFSNKLGQHNEFVMKYRQILKTKNNNL